MQYTQDKLLERWQPTFCVCVCVYVCAYKHTHTHTEGMSYATCQNVCGFLVTIDDSMFIQSQ